jgi:D-arabinose 1-dehydrogenase-like Zn-dependent alcohol dehydrogenase
MKILQIVAPHHPVWTDAPDPDLHEGEVLLKIEGVTTCPHWDLHILGGTPMFADRPLDYPYTPGEPGHEAVGTIVDLGPGVSGLERGMRVAAWRDPGGRRQGAYAEYMPIAAGDVLPVPENLPLSALASLELAMCVQASFDALIERRAVAGSRFAVSGLGPSGLIAVQMARAYGAREVVGIDPISARREQARALGADRVLEAGSDHGTRESDKFQAFAQRQQHLKGGLRTQRRLRLDAQGQGLLRHAVTALEPRRATQPGHGINDQTNMKKPHNTLLFNTCQRPGTVPATADVPVPCAALLPSQLS